MIQRTSTMFVAAATLLTLFSIAWAQPVPIPMPETILRTDAPALEFVAVQDEKEAKKKEKEPIPAPTKNEEKDPTTPSPKLKQLMSPPGKQGAAPVARISPMTLRGRVVAKGQPPIALLEVDGKVLVVAKGNTFPGGNNTMMRILEITSWEVRIEVLPMQETIILR